MRYVIRFFVVAVLIVLLPGNANASWLSDITGVDVNIPAGTISFGVPQPAAIPQMLQNLPQDVAIFLANPFAGAGLAFAIRQAKAAAHQACVPMPPQVVSTLTPFFPPDLFPGVCWTIVGNGNTLDSFAIHDANMAAITFEDVVVFRSMSDAYDAVLWSHELTHVRQYQSLGVEGFAALYTVAFDTLEQQARDFDQFVARSLQNVTPTTPYWVAANGWNSVNHQLNLRQFAGFARQSIPPSQCAVYQQVLTHSDAGPPAYVQVTNRCSVPVGVTSLSFRNTQTGQTRQAPCPSDCTVAPSTTKQWPVQPYDETTAVSMVWPGTDLCESGRYKEPGNGMQWNLSFTAQGVNGSRADSQCTIHLNPGDQTWKGELRCSNGSSFPVTMTPHNACARITSDIGWLEFAR
jgi:hypothetical protein